MIKKNMICATIILVLQFAAFRRRHIASLGVKGIVGRRESTERRCAGDDLKRGHNPTAGPTAGPCPRNNLPGMTFHRVSGGHS